MLGDTWNLGASSCTAKIPRMIANASTRCRRVSHHGSRRHHMPRKPMLRSLKVSYMHGDANKLSGNPCRNPIAVLMLRRDAPCDREPPRLWHPVLRILSHDTCADGSTLLRSFLCRSPRWAAAPADASTTGGTNGCMWSPPPFPLPPYPGSRFGRIRPRHQDRDVVRLGGLGLEIIHRLGEKSIIRFLRTQAFPACDITSNSLGVIDRTDGEEGMIQYAHH